ncbi:hypothetical protein QTO34_010802 [Cnephaeus nilssonii]|uniref:PH domain-containing protein n=1 Tax=Cnephaeus nilssonii TaxID=3371016 RepID=A0AA40HH63_CNENI|nr:hypothetical protein QTO34_010802 [Eptesicus nilssonii]
MLSMSPYSLLPPHPWLPTPLPGDPWPPSDALSKAGPLGTEGVEVGGQCGPSRVPPPDALGRSLAFAPQHGQHGDHPPAHRPGGELLRGSGQPLALPGRVLLGEGVLTKECRKKAQPRAFFLFSDILVYGSIVLSGRRYRAQRVIPLEEVTLELLPETLQARNRWLIRTARKSFVVSAASATERQEWIRHIEECVRRQLRASGCGKAQSPCIRLHTLLLQKAQSPRSCPAPQDPALAGGRRQQTPHSPSWGRRPLLSRELCCPRDRAGRLMGQSGSCFSKAVMHGM